MHQFVNAVPRLRVVRRFFHLKFKVKVHLEMPPIPVKNFKKCETEKVERYGYSRKEAEKMYRKYVDHAQSTHRTAIARVRTAEPIFSKLSEL